MLTIGVGQCGSRIARLVPTDAVLSFTGQSGNNWAVGYCVVGPLLADHIENSIRTHLEANDVHVFSIIHSLSGGTGSGLGSFVLELLSDIQPKYRRLSTVLFPSDDVVVGPYNAVLSLATLARLSHSIICLDNTGMAQLGSANSTVAKTLSHIARDKGDLLSGAQFWVPSLAPRKPLTKDIGRQGLEFDAAFSEFNPLLSGLPKRIFHNQIAVYINSAFHPKDIERNMQRTYPHTVNKFHHTFAPPKEQPSICTLSNTRDISTVISSLVHRFDKMFINKVFLHHYLDKLEMEELRAARNTVFNLSLCAFFGDFFHVRQMVILDHEHSSLGILGPYGPPYGAQPAVGGSPPMHQIHPGPQSSSWLLRNHTGPSFAPPAPAEAAANWANHASLASAKAENVLMDIEKIRADAVGQVKHLSAEADQILAKVQSMSAKTIAELQAESNKVLQQFAIGKKAVDAMYKSAGHNHSVKTVESSFAHTRHHFSDTSVGNSFAHKSSLPARSTGDPEVDDALLRIQQKLEQMGHKHHVGGAHREKHNFGGSHKNHHKHHSGHKHSHKHHHRHHSGHKHHHRHHSGHKHHHEHLADSRGTQEPNAASAALFHDTSNAINQALKAAKDIADKMTVREFDVERQLLEMLGRAQQSELKAAQVAGRAEVVAGRAVNYAQKMSHLAQYAQNAAGQAMAAQMAQAMGFPIAARGVPSPLPPPDVDAHIPTPYVPGMPLKTTASYQQPGMLGRLFGSRTGQSSGMFGRSTSYQPGYAGSGMPGNVAQYSIGHAAILLSRRETRMQNLNHFF